MTAVPTQSEIDRFVMAVSGHDIMHLLNFVQEYPDCVNVHDSEGITALVSASGLGSNLVVRFLLEWGADINMPATDGTTPLMAAAARAPLKTVELLLENGADETLCNTYGGDVRSIAAQWHRADVIGFFSQRRAAAEAILRDQAEVQIRKLSGQKPRNPFGKGPGAG